MNPKHILMGLAVLGVTLSVGPPAWADPPGWERTFDDETSRDMVPWDYYNWLYSGYYPTFFPEYVVPCTGCSPALRLSFTSSLDDAVGLFAEPASSATIFSTASGGVSAKMLVRFSTSPHTFATPDWRAFYVALAVNAHPQITADPINNLKGYWLYVGDYGANPNASPPTNNRLEVAIQYLAPPDQIEDLCPGTILDPFDPTKDWWMRAEALDDGAGGVLIRGRLWPDDGTPEPEIWHVQCTDTVYNYTSGMVAFGAEQHIPSEGTVYTSYIDVDTVSAHLIPEHVCYNHADDDLDGLFDCDDPDCAGSAACVCHDPFADADGDDDVDQVDFALFQACFTGSNPGGSIPAACECFDREDANADGFFNPPDDGNQDVNGTTDLDKFEACATGPGIAADPACDNVNY